MKYTGIFSKVRRYLPITCRKTVYNAFISPGLNYGSEIYLNQTKKYIEPLTVKQNKLLKILQFKNIRTPLKDLYREFNTLKLKDLHHYNICCIVHKFIHTPDLLSEATNELFCRNEQIHNYNTRQRKDLHPVKIKTKLYSQKTISFQGTTLWNNLSNHIKEILSLRVFKPKLKQHLQDKY